jgi:drug/metabolite transporter (DMT)-like permease
MSPDALADLLDYACWFTAFAAIGCYVLVFLRNRPHLRPLNALGLLLVGAALLGLPTMIGRPIVPARESITIYIVLLLVASAVFQAISAFRRRPRVRTDQATPAPVAVHDGGGA